MNIKQIILISFLSIFFISCSNEKLSYSWIENEWISDADASISINNSYDDLNAPTIEVIKSNYGHIKWIFSETTFTFQDERYDELTEFSVLYQIEPIDSQSFKVTFNDLETRIIWKTDNGFCTELAPEYIEHLRSIDVEGEINTIECFKPVGA